MLTVKPTKTIIGGIETDQNGIFLGDNLIVAYPMTEEWYAHARGVARAANLIHMRAVEGIKDPSKRSSVEASYMRLASKLNMNRYGMTNPERESLSLADSQRGGSV